MSDCENFKKIIERYVNDECFLEEKELLDAHTKECSKCNDDFLFALSIKNTLRSLPKIEVPDNFLVSLNEKLDEEEKLVSPRKKVIFGAWKKYSALAACLLLAVMLRVDVWDMSKVPTADDVVIETVQTTESAEEPAEEKVEIPSEEQVVEPVSQEVVQEAPKEEAPKEEAPKEEAPVKVQSYEKPQKPQKPEETPVLEYKEEETPQYIPPAEVIVMPTVALPAYMDSRDNIVIVPEESQQVRFEDYEIVVTDELLEAFSLAEMPSNNVIVASPAAMNSVQTLSFDTTAACEVPTGNYGAGSGTLFVSASDEEKVQNILNKYSIGAEDKTFMLSSSNYNSFIDELENEGISYQDYMINTTKTNVAFTLILS